MPRSASDIPTKGLFEGKKKGGRVGESTAALRYGQVRLAGADPDRLCVEVLVELLDAGFATVAAHLVAAEGHRGVHSLIAVDPHAAGADGLGELVRLADVAGPDAAAQAEDGR